MQDGRAGTRVDARPPEGGGAARQRRQSLCPPLRGPARGDLDLRRSRGGPCPDRLCAGGSATLPGSGESVGLLWDFGVVGWTFFGTSIEPLKPPLSALFVFNTH